MQIKLISKKMSIALVIFVLLTSIVTLFTPTNASAIDPPAIEQNNSIKYGDVDGDGQINAIDFALIKRYLLGTPLTENALKAADVNGDSLVDAIDFAIHKQFLLGIISVFPADKLPQTPIVPSFKDVSVHDPSVIKTNGTYYVIGSHLASAKTNDLMQWQQISSSVSNTNPLIPNVFTELKQSFDWAQTQTMWAGDIAQLQDGKYYMYYCLCKGDSPRSTLGLAVSDSVTGPYKDAGILLKSGMSGTSEAGTVYNATRDPNTVDPDTFFDKNGNLWMVYGSYSGGIFIMKMDPKTGKPYSGQGYGKKLLGGNHSRIEAPYMLYSPQSDYYYLFLSFGGLDATGGYNIRVARSKNPDGPFVDAAGKNMIDCYGAAGTLFDDKSIEPFGVKLMGNFKFAESGLGYVSPGHNSAYYDEQTKKYYLIFHTRFPGQGELHQVRVHQMFINQDGWPVVAPHRYGGENIVKYIADEVYGDYAFINHGKDISSAIKSSVKITLNSDGTISGNVNGKWQLSGENITLTVNGVDYSGVVLRQWDNGLNKFVMTFSATAKSGNVAIWGSKIN